MNPNLFKDHVVFSKIELLNQRISENEVIENIDIENIAFYKSAIAYINDRINKTIPELVQDAEINSLGSELEAGLTNINSYLARVSGLSKIESIIYS